MEKIAVTKDVILAMDFQENRVLGSIATAQPNRATTVIVPASEQLRTTLKKAFRHILLFAFVAALSFGSFQLISHFAFQSVQVVGVSMAPTLHDSDRYMLNRLVYHFREPEPRDIVVLRDPADNTYAVKRIIAKAGDTVVVKEGHLYVNGKELNEPYLPPNTPTFAGPRYREQMWICGVDQYFVLGDNRNNSADSRVYGTVPRQNILGRLSP